MYPEGQRILVIDDDERRCQLIERVLTEEGFAVTAVAQGFSAIRATTRGRFALAIASVNLPGTLDGPATMRQLRGRQPWLKVLFTGDVAQWPRRPDRIRDDLQAQVAQAKKAAASVADLGHQAGQADDVLAFLRNRRENQLCRDGLLMDRLLLTRRPRRASGNQIRNFVR